jgi:D-alanyl-D-alanine carboxypeptidase
MPEPELGVAAWALVDLKSGDYLAGSNPDRPLPMASTTKIVVALAALEMVEAGEASLDDEVVVSPEAAFYAQQIYSNVGLAAGDTLSVRELLLASLIASGDDAVYALAEGLGGGSVERFVDRMNAEARQAGMRKSHFENPTGLDARGQRASARDLARATRAAYEHGFFARAVATPYATVTTQQGREIYLENTNQLLFTYPKAIGVKTGTTPAAGPSLVSAARGGDESYVAVVLNATEDRFAASFRALEHGFAANSAGGSHHALHETGAGYCVFNDLALAAVRLAEEGRASAILIVDLDVHQGDGTAALTAGYPSIATYSVHAEKNFPARKARSTLDAPLPDGTGDQAYLRTLEETLVPLLDSFRPDLILYQGGVDPLAEDRLGRLALSEAGLTARDRFVGKLARERGIPLASTPGGGYGPDMMEIARRHSATIFTLAEAMGAARL